jgi:phage-related protein (TIGR01555 family)
MSKTAKGAVAALVSGVIATKKRIDAWSGVLLGLGQLASRDARNKFSVQWRRMAEQDIEEMYGGDSMAARVVDLPVEEATNKGYKIVGLSPEQAAKLSKRKDELHFDARIVEAARKARLYGGAAIMRIYENDDLRYDREIDKDAKKKPLKNLTVFHRFEIPAYWEDVQRDILAEDFRLPVFYTYVAHGATGDIGRANTKIHRSRLVLFSGAWLPTRLFESNNYWGDSVLSKPFDAIRNYAFAHDSVNAALKDMSVAKFKIKNLAEQMASDCDDKIIKRLEMVNLSKSIARAVVLDAEGEDFVYETRNMTGAHELVDRAKERLAGEAGISATVLFGESPTGGLGQSGDHESENWYDFVEAFQVHKLKPQMLQILREIAEELGIDPEKLDIVFNPLWQMSAKEEAEMRAKVAETDVKYIDAGVTDPSEVRESRFGGEEWTMETELDASIDAEDLKPAPEVDQFGNPKEDPNADPEEKKKVAKGSTKNKEAS